MSSEPSSFKNTDKNSTLKRKAIDIERQKTMSFCMSVKKKITKETRIETLHVMYLILLILKSLIITYFP
jgi:hypothetical protein